MGQLGQAVLEGEMSDSYRENKCWKSAEQAENGIEAAAWAIAAGLFAIAGATMAGARHLGTQDAATPMGALEHVAAELKGVAEAIRDHGESTP